MSEDKKRAFGCSAGCIAIVAVLFCCCGVFIPIGIYSLKKKKEEVVEADKLYEGGKKMQAVTVYKKNFDVVPNRAEYLKRIVETEIEQGSKEEAMKWVQRGIKDKINAKYDSHIANEMFAQAQKEHEAERKKQQAAEADNAEIDALNAAKVKNARDLTELIEAGATAIGVEQPYSYVNVKGYEATLTAKNNWSQQPEPVRKLFTESLLQGWGSILSRTPGLDPGKARSKARLKVIDSNGAQLWP
jgi:hypothetical protein